MQIWGQSRSKIFFQNQNLTSDSCFLHKITPKKSIFGRKIFLIEIDLRSTPPLSASKLRIFGAKIRFWVKIWFLGQKFDFSQKIKFLDQKSDFFTKIRFLNKNSKIWSKNRKNPLFLATLYISFAIWQRKIGQDIFFLNVNIFETHLHKNLLKTNF